MGGGHKLIPFLLYLRVTYIIFAMQVQKLCDRFVAEVDRLRALKDKDLKDNH